MNNLEDIKSWKLVLLQRNEPTGKQKHKKLRVLNPKRKKYVQGNMSTSEYEPVHVEELK